MSEAPFKPNPDAVTSGGAESQTAIPQSELMEPVVPIENQGDKMIDIQKLAPSRDERLFLVLSIFIGVISGLLVVSFRMAIS